MGKNTKNKNLQKGKTLGKWIDLNDVRDRHKVKSAYSNNKKICHEGNLTRNNTWGLLWIDFLFGDAKGTRETL